MRFGKKVLLAALTFTLTYANSVEKDISVLYKGNISFAAEEASTETTYSNVDSTAENSIVLMTDTTISDVKGIVEILKNELEDLIYNDDQNKILDNHNLELYKETYKYLLDLNGDQSKDNSEKYKAALINLISKKGNLETDKAKIEEELEDLGKNPENELRKNTLLSVQENLDSILKTLEAVKSESKDMEDGTKVIAIIIKKGDTYKKQLGQNSISKEENLVLSESIEDMIHELNEKLDNEYNRKYLSKKFYDESKVVIVNIKQKTEDANKEKLDQYLQDLTLINQNIDKIIEKVSSLDLSNLIEEIEKANLNKETQAYYRASKANRDNYVNTITEAETYLEGVLEKISDNPDMLYESEKIDQHIEKIKDAYDELDGLKYENLLKSTSEKLDANKKYLFEKSIKEIQKQLNLLSNAENKANTVDDVKYVSNLIDEKVKKDVEKKKETKALKNKTFKTSSKKEQAKVKKLAVPRAENKGKKKAKSIVRTGIDSVKIFGIIAVVAVVLLIVTKKRKDK